MSEQDEIITDSEWEELKDYSDYEINVNYPYQIRKKSNQRILKETLRDSNSYLCVSLNEKIYYKHRLIMNQFVENPDPDHLTQIDHINQIRTDNRLENLRWVSPSENHRNRSKYRLCSGEVMDAEYVDELPEEAIQVEQYGKYTFDTLYYFDNIFYQWNGVKYRIIKKYLMGNIYCVHVRDINNKRTTISYVKFKRLYNLD